MSANSLPPNDPPQWRSMDVAQCQTEYSPSSAIGGNYAPYIEQYQQQSSLAYSSCKHIETLTYGTADSQTLDIALPDGKPDSDGWPVIVFIHGGYWQALSKRDSFFGAHQFAARGIAYAALDYTLAPAASLIQIMDECQSALSTLSGHANEWNLNRQRIYLAGSSAGAHLSAICCGSHPTGLTPAGAILLSGIYELEPFVSITDNQAVGLTIEQARSHSPLLLDVNHYPPTVISWGEHETAEFKRQSLAMAHKLNQDSKPVRAFQSPARNHFDIVHDMADPATDLGQHVEQLLNRTRVK